MPVGSNSRCPFFLHFRHIRSFPDILQNFNLLRTLQHTFFYWVAVGEPSYKMRTALSPTSKMTKLRNSYPEGIACVLLFSSRFSNDGRIRTWSVERLFVLPVVRVETSCRFNGEASAFRVNCWSIKRVYSGSLSSETFGETSVSAFYY